MAQLTKAQIHAIRAQYQNNLDDDDFAFALIAADRAFGGVNAELLCVAQAALEWIDAVPSDTALPTMPGFDRDWADEAVASASAALSGAKKPSPDAWLTADGERCVPELTTMASARRDGGALLRGVSGYCVPLYREVGVMPESVRALVDLVEEMAGDLENEAKQKYMADDVRVYPSMERAFAREMEVVNRARLALAAMGKMGHDK